MTDIHPVDIKDPEQMLRWAAKEIDDMTQFLVTDDASLSCVIELCYGLRANVMGIAEEISRWLAEHKEAGA